MIEVEFREYDPPRDGVTAEWLDVATGLAPIPGDMFFAPWILKAGDAKERLTEQYWARPEPRRPPVVVVLPGRAGVTWHCVDERYYNADQGYHGGWNVSGEPPAVTVTPSIDIKGWWHGWLTNGELS